MALRNQIVEAIEEEYLQPLRNNITDMITSTIPVIFGFLQLNYGNLSPSELKERERTLDDMIYDPSQNVDSIFNKIQEFQDMCTLISNEKNWHATSDLRILMLPKNGYIPDKSKRVEYKATTTEDIHTL